MTMVIGSMFDMLKSATFVARCSVPHYMPHIVGIPSIRRLRPKRKGSATTIVTPFLTFKGQDS
jgi:hypothetical protein